MAENQFSFPAMNDERRRQFLLLSNGVRVGEKLID